MTLSEPPHNGCGDREADSWLDRLPCGAGLSNAVGQIQRANSKLARLLGSQTDREPPSLFTYIEPSDRADLQALWRLLIRGQLNVIRAELRLSEPGGGCRWTRWSIGTCTDTRTDANGQPFQAVVLVEDAHTILGVRHEAWRAQNELEQRLRQRVAELEQTLRERDQARRLAAQTDSLRTLGEAAAGVAHDFNNSLAEITSVTDLLLSDPDLAGRVREKLQIILSASWNAASTVDRIQRFARLGRSVEEPTPIGTRGAPAVGEAVNLSALTAELPTLTRHRWQSLARSPTAEVRFATALAEDVWVRADATELRDLLVNLVLNAIDALPTGGLITLSTGVDDDRAFAAVRDTGVGMDDSTRQRCFELFFSTKGAAGSGIGLATSLATARRLGGDILVESRRGNGSLFTLVLPKCAAPAPPMSGASAPPMSGASAPPMSAASAPPMSAASAPPMSGASAPPTAEDRSASVTELAYSPPQPRSVLLVDDQLSMIEPIARLLIGLGHRVVCADCGEQALRLFQPGEFDLVLTDLNIPDGNGLQLADRLKKLDPELRVVLLTGWGRDLARYEGLLTVVDRILAKPIGGQQLGEVVAAMPRRVGRGQSGMSATETNAAGVTGGGDPSARRRAPPADA